MINELRIGLFQMNIVWEDIVVNRLKIETILNRLSDVPDILVFPEMFTTGFSTINSNWHIHELNLHVDWQLELSAKHNVTLMGSVIMPEGDMFKNRLLITYPNSTYDYYDKRHLFQEEKNKGLFLSGNERKIFKYGDLKIMPQICYDLRFPVWSRNNLNYQVLINVANWPSARQKAWKTLLTARAIENQCFVIGVNRVGEDGNGIKYRGGSMVISPMGEDLLVLKSKEEYAEINLDMNNLFDFHEKFPVYKDSDKFTIQ
jgi:omega-amidase